MRQDLIAAGDNRHRNAQFGVGVDELGASDAGADHDKVLGQLLQVIELAPVQDSLAVGLGVGQHPRAGAGGDQHDVGPQLADGAVMQR